jgi:competence protein ComEA
MFRRQSPVDASVVEAARRRLEALAPGPLDLSSSDSPGAAPPSFEPDQESSREGGRHAARPSSVVDRLLGRVHDALPLRVRGRAGIASQHLTVLALLIAAVVALAAWWVLRSEPQPVEPPTLSSRPMSGIGITPSPGMASPFDVTASTAGAVPSAAETASPASGRLVVDVAGKVRHPGIVELPAGSRVIDAIRAAGGARPHVDLSSINLARLLVDGEQILVGVAPVSPSDPFLGDPARRQQACPVRRSTSTPRPNRSSRACLASGRSRRRRSWSGEPSTALTQASMSSSRSTASETPRWPTWRRWSRCE